ncbi:unnamed protein product [Staurois parvus]|uniref:Uncharacterized protein n=1 Tax=Staurois parvus TaxID=386267 RepID=A0ABN9HQB8_9NEOB|nr:unnamed protein product [Staurois parvus]
MFLNKIAVFTYIRDLTRGRSHILVLSAGNVFPIRSLFTNIRDLTRGRSHFPVPVREMSLTEVLSSCTSGIILW